jgi:hypothetical protein
MTSSERARRRAKESEGRIALAAVVVAHRKQNDRQSRQLEKLEETAERVEKTP